VYRGHRRVNRWIGEGTQPIALSRIGIGGNVAQCFRTNQLKQTGHDKSRSWARAVNLACHHPNQGIERLACT
jgi:hypothetical protein